MISALAHMAPVAIGLALFVAVFAWLTDPHRGDR